MKKEVKKRVIIDYKNITSEILKLFTDAYPYGHDEDIIKFTNAKGESVKAVPLETDDTKYLIKVSVEMDQKIDDFLEEDDNPTGGNSEIPEQGDLDD
tara:strand:+ start:33259 stop:33549 length:291 start_codon:yes stop_codon:yes gene_type:complete